MNFGILGAALTAATLIAGSASASTMNASFAGAWDQFDGPANLSGGTSDAGALSVTLTSANGKVQNFIAWCADLAVPIVNGTEYSTSPSLPSLNATQVSNLAKLATLADVANLDLSTEEHSSGLNLAIWEIVHESASNAYDIATGNFFAIADTFANTNGYEEDLGEIAAVNYAQGLLNQLSSSTATSTYNVTFLKSDKNDSQNMVTFTPVPVPAAAILLLSGVAGLGFAARRKAA